MKKGLPQTFLHVLCCPIKISILFNLSCVYTQTKSLSLFLWGQNNKINLIKWARGARREQGNSSWPSKIKLVSGQAIQHNLRIRSHKMPSKGRGGKGLDQMTKVIWSLWIILFHMNLAPEGQAPVLCVYTTGWEKQRLAEPIPSVNIDWDTNIVYWSLQRPEIIRGPLPLACLLLMSGLWDHRASISAVLTTLISFQSFFL